MKANHDILVKRLNTVSYRALIPHYLITNKLSGLKTKRIHSSELITGRCFNFSQNKIPTTRTSKSIQNKEKITLKKSVFPIKVEKYLKQYDEFYVEECVTIQKLTPCKSSKFSSDSIFSRLKRKKISLRNSLTNNIEIQTG